ncbi:MAG: fumarylacetoacetate hydrolase family protein [Aestuariibacter sp.]
MYQHKFTNTDTAPLAAGKAVCVGRNYLEHVRELNNEVPEEPLLFIKANHCFVSMHDALQLPEQGECHNELEVALLIGETLSKDSTDDPLSAVIGIGLALDLTLRDVQQRLKDKGHPWERAKAFDGSCPLSHFVPVSAGVEWQNLSFSLTVNNELRQQGNTRDMMFSCEQLLREIIKVCSLVPGDVVLTGTPKGVGPLLPGDKLSATLVDLMSVSTVVKN